MPKPQRDSKAEKNKLLSRRYKLIGGGILLLSFITQTLLFDYFNAKSQAMDTAFLNQAVIDKSILLNENLYFTANLGGEGLDSQTLKDMKQSYIREAARKTALSHSIRLGASDMSNDDIVKYSNEFISRANQVKDFVGFSELNKYINKFDVDHSLLNDAYVVQVSNNRDIARWAYLVSYLIGSGILLLGIRYE
jgi:hypothetical protein